MGKWICDTVGYQKMCHCGNLNKIFQAFLNSSNRFNCAVIVSVNSAGMRVDCICRLVILSPLNSVLVIILQEFAFREGSITTLSPSSCVFFFEDKVQLPFGGRGIL